MAAKGEEVVGQAHLWHLQDFGPDLRQLHLQRILRCLVNHLCRDRLWQRLDVDLAVDSERQVLQHHQIGWHHVFGQQAFEGGADRVLPGHAVGRHLAGHQPCGQLQLRCLAMHAHQRVGDTLQRTQLAFDFGQLHTVATDFHLAIHAPGKLQVAALAYPVAAAVQPLAVPAAWIRDEALGRERRAIQVTTGQPGATDVQLALGLGRQRLQATVEYRNAGIGQWLAEAGLLVKFSDQHADSGLGRAVVVEHLERRVQMANFSQQARADGLTAQHQALRWQRRTASHQHRLQVRRHDLQRVYLMLGQVGSEAFGIQYLFTRQHVQSVAAAQGTEQHGVAQVGGRRRNLGHAADALDRQARGDAIHVVGQSAVADRHALGLPGGARGVDHIGQVGRLGRWANGTGATRLRPVDALHAISQFSLPVTGCQHQARVAVGQHVGQALGRLFRLQRQVCATGLEHTQDAGEHANAAVGQHADQRVRPYPGLAQAAGNSFGTGIELGKTGLLARGHYRRTFGVTAGGSGKSLVHQPGCLDRLQLTLGNGQARQCQLADSTTGFIGQRLHQGQPLLAESFDSNSVEHIGGVGERRVQLPGALVCVQCQIEAGAVLLQRDRRQAQAGAGFNGLHIRHLRLVVEQHAEQRALGAARQLQGLDQLLEWQILVALGAQSGHAHALQQASDVQQRVDLSV